MTVDPANEEPITEDPTPLARRVIELEATVRGLNATNQFWQAEHAARVVEMNNFASKRQLTDKDLQNEREISSRYRARLIDARNENARLERDNADHERFFAAQARDIGRAYDEQHVLNRRIASLEAAAPQAAYTSAVDGLEARAAKLTAEAANATFNADTQTPAGCAQHLQDQAEFNRLLIAENRKLRDARDDMEQRFHEAAGLRDQYWNERNELDSRVVQLEDDLEAECVNSAREMNAYLEQRDWNPGISGLREVLTALGGARSEVERLKGDIEIENDRMKEEMERRAIRDRDEWSRRMDHLTNRLSEIDDVLADHGFPGASGPVGVGFVIQSFVDARDSLKAERTRQAAEVDRLKASIERLEKKDESRRWVRTFPNGGTQRYRFRKGVLQWRSDRGTVWFNSAFGTIEELFANLGTDETLTEVSR